MQCVQAIHAAVEAVHHFYQSVTNLHTVVLTVENIQEARQLLDRRGIRYRYFIDSDLGPDITALATEPITGEKRKAFSNYPLLRFGLTLAGIAKALPIDEEAESYTRRLIEKKAAEFESNLIDSQIDLDPEVAAVLANMRLKEL